MKRLALLAPLIALFLVAPATAEDETTLLFVRHAEKQATPGNPDLTDRGLARAEVLAGIAEEWNVRAVYSTDFCRTAQTAQPAAQRVGVPIAIQSTGSPVASLDGCTPPVETVTLFLDSSVSSAADLLSWILDQHPGSAVLVVGHSNTVPRLLARIGLGSFAGVEIDEDEYDRLFIVTYRKGESATLLERSYGEIYDEVPTETLEKPVARLDIVDRAIEHHGGDTYGNSRSSLTITSKSGSFDLDVRRSGGLFDMAVSDQRDGARRVTRATNDGVERSLDGAPQVLDTEAARRAGDFVNARVYFPFLPYGLNDPNTFKIDQGLEEWDGRSLHRVKVVFTPGTSTDASDEYVYWFEPDTARLVQYAYSFGANSETGGLRFRRLSNYRRVGGLLFFDADNLGIDGSGSFSVDSIDPQTAAAMELVSEVRLSNLEVNGSER